MNSTTGQSPRDFLATAALVFGLIAIVESEEVQPGVVLDFDKDGKVVGIEILHMKELVPQSDLKRIQVEFA